MLPLILPQSVPHNPKRECTIRDPPTEQAWYLYQTLGNLPSHFDFYRSEREKA